MASVATPSGPFTELDARRLGRVRRYFLRNPRVMDAVVAALFGVPALLQALLAGVVPELSRAPEQAWVQFGGALVLVGVLLRRRDTPILAAGAVAVVIPIVFALSGDSGGTEFAAVVMVYTVASLRRPLLAWSVLVGLAVVYVVSASLFYAGGPWSTVEGDGADHLAMTSSVSTAAIIAMLIALAIGVNVRARREHVASLIDRANSMARDRDQQAQLAVAGERARIAREMHDVVAHSLTVMVALAEGAKAAGARDPVNATRALDALTETGRSALDDMRRVLGVLRDPDADVPLEPERAVPLDELAERFRAAGLPVRTAFVGELPPEGDPVRDAAARIVQESLTNVLRYAPGSPFVLVELSRRDERAAGGGDWLDVSVLDEGPAPTLQPRLGVGTGRGIIGMQERAALHGGTVSAGSVGAGWRVHATLRLDAPGRGTP